MYFSPFVEKDQKGMFEAKYFDKGSIETGYCITQFSYSKKSLRTVVWVNDSDKMIVTGGNLKDTKVSKNFTKSKQEKENIRSVNYFSINEQGKEKTYRFVRIKKK